MRMEFIVLFITKQNGLKIKNENSIFFDREYVLFLKCKNIKVYAICKNL